MSVYASDPRVRRIDDDLFTVDAPGGPYNVCAWLSPDEWVLSPAIGSALSYAAHLHCRDDAEAWSRTNRRGPFASSDAAIRSLIGDPQ